jgi:hypothetical protein
MYQGRDAAISNKIGRILLGVMPPSARSITAEAKVGDDWSEVGFEFENLDGSSGTFSFDDHPEDAAGDIGDELVDLRKIMAEGGAEAWNRAYFTVDRDEKFEVKFSYEPEPAP